MAGPPPSHPRHPPGSTPPPCTSPLQSSHHQPFLRGRQHLGSHSPSTWGPPHLRDGISLSLATTNTQPRGPASSLCLLLSPWRPQCHRGGSLATATTVTQRPAWTTAPSTWSPPTQPQGQGQPWPLLSKAATSPSRDRTTAPACRPTASWCHTALLPPPKFNDTGSGLVFMDSTCTAPAPSPSAAPLYVERPPRREKRPDAPRPPFGSRPPPPTPGTDAPCPAGVQVSLAQPLSWAKGHTHTRGVCEPAGLPPHPPQCTCPSPQKAHPSASCLTGPVDEKLGRSGVGVPAAGGRGQAGQEGTNRRQRLGYITGFSGQVM